MLDKLPCGYVYMFKVQIIDDGVNMVSEPSKETIDLRIGKNIREEQ